MLGFAFFTFGHANMVRYTLQRMDRASRDVAEIVERSSDKPESQPSILRHLAAHKVGIVGAMVVHVSIDLCVFGAFALQLGVRLHWW